MTKLQNLLMHPDRHAITRRAEHLEKVLLARKMPEDIAALRAVQYREYMWRENKC